MATSHHGEVLNGTHVPDHSAAADGFLTKPITAALRGHTHEAPATPVTTPDIHYVQILQRPQANTARTWACLGLLSAVIWFLMMDHGNIGGFQTGPRFHPDGHVSFQPRRLPYNLAYKGWPTKLQ